MPEFKEGSFIRRIDTLVKKDPIVFRKKYKVDPLMPTLSTIYNPVETLFFDAEICLKGEGYDF